MHSVVSVSVYFAYISNVEENIYICRWIKRYIIALWMNICFIMAHTINEYTNLLSNIYIFHLTSSNYTWKKNPKNGEFHIRRWTSPVKWSKKPVYQRSNDALGVRRFGKWSLTNVNSYQRATSSSNEHIYAIKKTSILWQKYDLYHP